MTGLLYFKYDSLIKIMRKHWNCYRWTCVVYTVCYISWIFVVVVSTLKLWVRSGRGVQHYVIKFVSDLRQVGGFPRYSWNIAGSGVKYHKTNQLKIKLLSLNLCGIYSMFYILDICGVSIVGMLDFCHHCLELINCRYHSIILRTNLLSKN